MSKRIKMLIGVFFLSWFVCTTANAWQGAIYGGGYGGNRHYHEYDRGYGWRGYPHGGGWGYRPNVIINVPAEPRYYAPCETVRICDQSTDRCWLERHCG